jgi:hypothetical protein
MSWLRCFECDEYFDAKDGQEWTDLDGRVTCFKCLQDIEYNRERDKEELSQIEADAEVLAKDERI